MKKEEYLPYTDYLGLIQNLTPTAPEGSWTSGNGLLYSAEALLVLKMNEQLDPTICKQVADAVKKCELEPGLYCRHPVNYEQEGPDDNIGLAVISHLTRKPDIAQSILKYGREKPTKISFKLMKTKPYVSVLLGGWFPLRYYYSFEIKDRFDVRAFIGRFPAVLAILKMAAQEKVSIFYRFYTALAMIVQPWRSEDEPILTMLTLFMCHEYYPNSWLFKWADKVFCKKLIEKYPLGMPEVYGKYFGAAHPNTKYTPRFGYKP